MLKPQQRFKSRKPSIFTEVVNKIALSAFIKTYTYGTNEEIIHRKEKIKCNNIIKQ